METYFCQNLAHHTPGIPSNRVGWLALAGDRQDHWFMPFLPLDIPGGTFVLTPRVVAQAVLLQWSLSLTSIGFPRVATEKAQSH